MIAKLKPTNCWMLIAVSCLFASPIAKTVHAADPTVASKQIAERLSVQNQADEKANPFSDAPRFRLKAMVLRDRENGVALIELKPAETYFIRLRRSELRANGKTLLIRGEKFLVKEFSRSSIVMIRVDTLEQFVVD